MGEPDSLTTGGAPGRMHERIHQILREAQQKNLGGVSKLLGRIPGARGLRRAGPHRRPENYVPSQWIIKSRTT